MNLIDGRFMARPGETKDFNGMRRRWRTLGIAILAGAAFSVFAGGRSVWATSPVTFTYNGSSSQSWTVPPGVSSATFTVYGAQGGASSGSVGGRGGEALSTLTVVPGQIYTL